jgi:hypothetical protein
VKRAGGSWTSPARSPRLSRNRRTVWIDDDLAAQAADTGEWPAAHPHVLVVAPDLFAGLTHEQLDEIEALL